MLTGEKKKAAEAARARCDANFAERNPVRGKACFQQGRDATRL